MQTPCSRQGAATEQKGDQEHALGVHALTNLSPPPNQALRCDGRYPHSDTCEELARSGLFGARPRTCYSQSLGRRNCRPGRLLALSPARIAGLEKMAEISH
jgi:hypothetical protein